MQHSCHAPHAYAGSLTSWELPVTAGSWLLTSKDASLIPAGMRQHMGLTAHRSSSTPSAPSGACLPHVSTANASQHRSSEAMTHTGEPWRGCVLEGNHPQHTNPLPCWCAPPPCLSLTSLFAASGFGVLDVLEQCVDIALRGHAGNHTRCEHTCAEVSSTMCVRVCVTSVHVRACGCCVQASVRGSMEGAYVCVVHTHVVACRKQGPKSGQAQLN